VKVTKNRQKIPENPKSFIDGMLYEIRGRVSVIPVAAVKSRQTRAFRSLPAYAYEVGRFFVRGRIRTFLMVNELYRPTPYQLGPRAPKTRGRTVSLKHRDQF
jgi:hypothetical protein